MDTSDYTLLAILALAAITSVTAAALGLPRIARILRAPSPAGRSSGIGWVLAVALLLRLGVALRPLPTLDLLFIPDDTYYSLSIARSLAHGLGPTADGVRPTSGFQPLWVALLVPSFLATAQPDGPVRVALVLGALLDGLTVVPLWRLGRRLAGDTAGLAAAAIWAISPVAIGNALCGLETALALFATAVAVEMWCQAHDRPGHLRYAIAGVATGLALLARVDTASLALLLGVTTLGSRRRRFLPAAVTTATLVVLPWWLYCARHFGSAVPESGAALRTLLTLSQSWVMTPWIGAVFGAAALAGPPFLDVPAVHMAVLALPPLAPAVLALTLGAVLLACARVARLRGPAPLAALLLHAIVIWGFYSFYLPAFWFFRRYLAPTQLVLALVAGAIWALAPGGRGGRGGRGARAILAVAMIAALGLSFRWLLWTPSASPDSGVLGAKGYRAPVEELLRSVPPGSHIGAFQSGALSYFRPAGVSISNLDGVVDGAAATALRDGQLASFARSRHITHLIDWDLNLDLFRRQAGEEVALKVLATTTHPQGADTLRLVRLDQPASR